MQEVAWSYGCGRKNDIITRNKFVGIKDIIQVLEGNSHLFEPGHFFLYFFIDLVLGLSVCNSWQDESRKYLASQNFDCSSCKDSLSRPASTHDHMDA